MRTFLVKPGAIRALPRRLPRQKRSLLAVALSPLHSSDEGRRTQTYLTEAPSFRRFSFAPPAERARTLCACISPRGAAANCRYCSACRNFQQTGGRKSRSPSYPFGERRKSRQNSSRTEILRRSRSCRAGIAAPTDPTHELRPKHERPAALSGRAAAYAQLWLQRLTTLWRGVLSGATGESSSSSSRSMSVITRPVSAPSV